MALRKSSTRRWMGVLLKLLPAQNFRTRILASQLSAWKNPTSNVKTARDWKQKHRLSRKERVPARRGARNKSNILHWERDDMHLSQCAQVRMCRRWYLWCQGWIRETIFDRAIARDIRNKNAIRKIENGDSLVPILCNQLRKWSLASHFRVGKMYSIKRSETVFSWTLEGISLEISSLGCQRCSC